METPAYIRKGYHAITPSLVVADADAAMDWYKKIFDAEEVMCMRDPQGVILHAELRIGDSLLMLSDENPDYNISPQSLSGTPVILNLYVPNADDLVERAVTEGAKVIFPVEDQFYGDRSGRIQDPFGHLWIISSVIEEIDADEMQRRFEAVNSKK